jgi:hypothetical protein
VLLLITLALTGCGGSGKTETVTRVPGTPFDELGLKARLLQDTDIWFYSFRGTIDQGSGDVPITGRVERLVEKVNVSGQNYRALADIFLLSSVFGDGIATSTQYFRQDNSSRQITTYGVNENGNLRMYAQPQEPLLKTGNVGDSASQTLTYADGTVETVRQTVVGTELITVPAGKFMTYKIEGTRQSPTQTITFTNWYSRQLGSFVRSDDASTLSNGQTITRHMELTSTNVTPAD